LLIFPAEFIQWGVTPETLLLSFKSYFSILQAPSSWAPLLVFPPPSDLQVFGCLRTWSGSYSIPSIYLFFPTASNIMFMWVFLKLTLWAISSYIYLLDSYMFKYTLTKPNHCKLYTPSSFSSQ
jgi:hypothetical protein